MATKLQELLEELKGLKRYTNAIDIKGYSHFIEQGNGKIIMKTDLEELITKYTETTPMSSKDGKFYGDLPDFKNTVDMGDLINGAIKPTYKLGDNVRIISDRNIINKGEEAMLVKRDDDFKSLWLCSNDRNKNWIWEDEFEPIN